MSDEGSTDEELNPDEEWCELPVPVGHETRHYAAPPPRLLGVSVETTRERQHTDRALSDGQVRPNGQAGHGRQRQRLAQALAAIAHEPGPGEGPRLSRSFRFLAPLRQCRPPAGPAHEPGATKEMI